LAGLLMFTGSAVCFSEELNHGGTVASPRVWELSDELIKARAILSCGERHGSADSYTFSGCVYSFIAMGRGQVPPQVSELSPDKIQALMADAKGTVEQRLMIYVCDRIRWLFKSPNRGKECLGTEELKPSLFFELVSDHTSKTPRILMTIYGP